MTILKRVMGGRGEAPPSARAGELTSRSTPPLPLTAELVRQLSCLVSGSPCLRRAGRFADSPKRSHPSATGLGSFGRNGQKLRGSFRGPRSPAFRAALPYSCLRVRHFPFFAPRPAGCRCRVRVQSRSNCIAKPPRMTMTRRRPEQPAYSAFFEKR